MKIFIAHAGRDENVLRKYEEVALKKYSDATFEYGNYSENKKQCIEAAKNADSLIIAGHGRVIMEDGVDVVNAFEKEFKHVFFVVAKQDVNASFDTYNWVSQRTGKTHNDQPYLQRLCDVRKNIFFGQRSYLLPAFPL